MYLANVRAENFRLYGSGDDDEPSSGPVLDVSFGCGLTVLVGENDSGKSAIIDAIRLCLTSSADYFRISPDDFHCGAEGQATALSIACTFRDLSEEETGAFLEFLTAPGSERPFLQVTLRAEVLDPLLPHRVSVTVRAGDISLDGAARELLSATYLRPLRDAEAEMRAGRNSRLSQILTHYPSMDSQKDSDFVIDGDAASTLVGIMHRAEHHINANSLVQGARDEINKDYLSKFTIGNDVLSSAIGVGAAASLQNALERLQLTFAPEAGRSDATRHGLGYNNALFMAAELLLLGKRGFSPLLLIEEPEAHLHPQLQSRVVDLLVEKSTTPAPVQVIVTTHSPNIASTVPVEQLRLVLRGEVYSLEPQHTKLDASDYAYLTRFLDATRANLFFARGVAVVEGDAEALLLPSLAGKLGYPFAQNGVSVVNVGTVGLFRYSRVFQRQDGTVLPVRVACITDLDIAPASADAEMRKKLPSVGEMTSEQITARADAKRKRDGGSVRTFVSNWWTLEYDLARASWPMATLMHQAVQCACASGWPDEQEIAAITERAAKEIEDWRLAGDSLERAALKIYRPLRVDNKSKAVTAQHAAQLLAGTSITADDVPPYLVEAFSYLAGGNQL